MLALRYHVAICAVLTLLTLGSFWRTFENEFVSLDDPAYVTANTSVQKGLTPDSVRWAFTTLYLANWHPLTWLSLELDYELFKLDPTGFHATNLFLHAANVLTVYWFLWLCTKELVPSALAAAFFAVHPLHVESVAWISERKDVLSTFFLLFSMVAWVNYARRRSRSAYLLSLCSFLLSLMAKAMGVTLPLLLLLLDAWPLNSEARTRGNGGAWWRRMLIAEKLPFFLASAASAVITYWAQRQAGALDYGLGIPFAYRLAVVPVNYLSYLWRTFWPVGLIAFYRHPGASLPLWKPAAATTVLVAMSLVVWRQRSLRRYFAVGWFWFLIALLPVIGIVQIGGQATADRYMYLPLLGLQIGVCWGVQEAAIRWRAGVVIWLAAILCLAACAVLTNHQVNMWHDAESLYTPLTKW